MARSESAFAAPARIKFRQDSRRDCGAGSAPGPRFGGLARSRFAGARFSRLRFGSRFSGGSPLRFPGGGLRARLTPRLAPRFAPQAALAAFQSAATDAAQEQFLQRKAQPPHGGG